MRYLLVALLTLALPLPTLAEGIALTVEGLRNDRGKVLVVVFDQARAFNRLKFSRAVDFAEIPARAGKVRHNFVGLNAGPYAIFLFHDENGDEDLNRKGNHLLEGLGATGAPNPEDDPDFAQAAVFPGPVTVRVHYDR